MALFGNLILRVLMITIGLALAMLAAGLFISFGSFFGMISDFMADFFVTINGDPYATADPSWFVTMIVIVIGFFTSFHVATLAALPVFIAIVLAEGFRWHGMTINLVLGGLVALATGMQTYSSAGGEGMPSEGTVIVLLATGFIAGFVYWVVAGRSAGKWLGNERRPAA